MTSLPTHKEIISAIAKIRKVKEPNIDGAVLSNLVRICYECALKKSDLINLTVGDVSKKGKVGEEIRVPGSENPRRPTARGKYVIQQHIDDLKDAGYRLYSSYPLFPTKKTKRKYNGRTLDYHLNKALDGNRINLEEIRQAGIHAFYNSLRSQGISDIEGIKLASNFAGISERHASDLLKGAIQSTGKKLPPIIRHSKKIRNFEKKVRSVGSLDKISPPNYDQIRRSIKKDPKLNDFQEKYLLDELSRTRQTLKKELSRDTRATTVAKPPESEPLSEIIQSIKLHETDPHDSSLDLSEYHLSENQNSDPQDNTNS
jgi:hypothetical protein